MAPKARVQKRLYYKIGEACKTLGIQPYVLRYWASGFPALSPSKSRSGQRVYSEKELEVIRRIKQLLYDEGYTIAGAKKKLEGELAAGTLGDPAGAALPPPAAPLAFQGAGAAPGPAAHPASVSAPAGAGTGSGAGAGAGTGAGPGGEGAGGGGASPGGADARPRGASTGPGSAGASPGGGSGPDRAVA